MSADSTRGGKCQQQNAVCGRNYYYKGSILRSIGESTGTAWVLGVAKAAAGKKNICPDCRRAGYTDKGLSGGSVSGGNDAAQAAKIAAKAAQEERLAQERAEREARHKAAIQAIKDFQFDESDDDSFNRSAVTFIEDYKTCNPGLMVDKDYKKAYTQRIENELKILKTSNESMYQKLNELYSEAKAEMKAKLKKRLIASGILLGAGSIAAGIIIAVSEEKFVMFFAGLALGLVFPGMVLASIPQMFIGHKKSEDE